MANLDLKNPAVQKGVLSGLLSVGLLGVFFFTHLLPFGYPTQKERVDTLKTEFERKQTDLARARATVADLPRFEAEFDALHDRWQYASELLPTDRQLGSLLRRITLAGQGTGVDFVRFRPESPKTETYYTEMPVQIAVTGGYHQVGSFLAELANLQRIVTVSQMKLKTNTDGGADPLLTTSIELTASAYSLNPTPAPTAPVKPGKGGSHAVKS
jgi:type IV pilus assembly protein PilO